MSQFLRLHSLFKALCFSVLAWLGTGLFFPAEATTPLMDASCNSMNQHGFTASIVYCVEASINNAVNVYVASLITVLRPYEYAALVLAVAMFGFKMMNSSVREPVKEGMKLVMRVLIGVFFYSQAALIYKTIAGTPPANDGIINQLINLVTGFTSSGGSASGTGTMFSNLINTNCTVVTAPYTNYGGFQIWQAFDCMFAKIFGAANLNTHPEAFATSMLVIIGAALFSASFGIMITMFGLGLFMTALLLIFRALYLVLMAYICIGFVSIFAPLVAPLLFFESQFLTEKFKNWLGVIVSCIFQPVFVIGFLALAVVVDDQFIEGNLAGCHPPTALTATSTVGGAPAQGYGQDGSGVCSFSQLFNGTVAGGNAAIANNDASLPKKFADYMEQNATYFNMAIVGSPQLQAVDSTGKYDPVVGDDGTITYTERYGTQKGTRTITPQTNQITEGAANASGSNMTRLKQYVPLRQFMLTLFCFIFVTAAMYSLLDVIPQMANAMTIAMGVTMTRGIAKEVNEMVSGVTDNMEKSLGQLTGSTVRSNPNLLRPSTMSRK